MATQLIAPPQNARNLTSQSAAAGIPMVGETQAAASRFAVPAVVGHRNELFSEALLEMSSTRPKRRVTDVLMSVGVHIFVLVAVILPSLYFTDSIDLNKFSKTFLVGPPPPPPPPPVAQAITKVVPTPRRILTQGKLLAPIAIPQKVVIIKEEMPSPDLSGGVAGGVPGGVVGGQLGGVIGGIIAGSAHSNIPVPVSAPKAPIRVGGRIRAPRATFQPAPIYPILAKQTRLQGVVSIDAVIDAEGNVMEMHVVSGQPLLIPAALDAVRQWKYEPTYLNDQAIPVQLIVMVTFHLQE